MTLEEIKQALADGKRVFWKNFGYEVIQDCEGQYCIVWNLGGRDENCIDLTWRDGMTLNGEEKDFFVKVGD